MGIHQEVQKEIDNSPLDDASFFCTFPEGRNGTRWYTDKETCEQSCHFQVNGYPCKCKQNGRFFRHAMALYCICAVSELLPVYLWIQQYVGNLRPGDDIVSNLFRRPAFLIAQWKCT